MLLFVIGNRLPEQFRHTQLSFFQTVFDSKRALMQNRKGTRIVACRAPPCWLAVRPHAAERSNDCRPREDKSRSVEKDGGLSRYIGRDGGRSRGRSEAEVVM